MTVIVGYKNIIHRDVTGLCRVGGGEGAPGLRGVGRGSGDGGERGHHPPAPALRPHQARHPRGELLLHQQDRGGRAVSGVEGGEGLHSGEHGQS